MEGLAGLISVEIHLTPTTQIPPLCDKWLDHNNPISLAVKQFQ